MFTSTVDEAQAQLETLIGLAERGEEIIIARAGKPVARILPYTQAKTRRSGGQWHGNVSIAPDYDVLPSDYNQAFGLPE